MGRGPLVGREGIASGPPNHGEKSCIYVIYFFTNNNKNLFVSFPFKTFQNASSVCQCEEAAAGRVGALSVY